MNPLHPTLAVCVIFGTAAISFAQTTPKSPEFLKTYASNATVLRNPRRASISPG